MLGPLLFLIHINDLCDMIENCSLFLYADDTVLVANDIDIHEAHSKLENDLTRVAGWCRGNKLSINIKKKQKHDSRYQINGKKTCNHPQIEHF